MIRKIKNTKDKDANEIDTKEKIGTKDKCTKEVKNQKKKQLNGTAGSF